MLVLTRKEGQSIQISPAVGLDESMTVKDLFRAGSIRINIKKAAGHVILGIEAPPELPVLMSELTDTIEK